MRNHLSSWYALRGRGQVIASNELLPSPHNILHRGSFLWILPPTALEEIPDLSCKAYRLGVPRHLRSTSLRNAVRDLIVLLSLERYLTGEDFHCEHRKGQHVISFRLHDRYGASFARGGYDFRGKPSGGPNGSWGCGNSETRVRVDERQPVFRQTSATPLIDDDVGLSARNQHDRTTNGAKREERTMPHVLQRDRGEDLPPLNHHAQCPDYEGTPVPSLRRTATGRVGRKTKSADTS